MFFLFGEPEELVRERQAYAKLLEDYQKALAHIEVLHRHLFAVSVKNDNLRASWVRETEKK